MKIKFYLIILFFINKSYHIEFIKNLNFSTTLSYSILFLGAATYINQDYKLLKKIREKNEICDKNEIYNIKNEIYNIKNVRATLPLSIFITGVASYYCISYAYCLWCS